MSWNRTSGTPMKIQLSIFDDRYEGFSGNDDWVLPIVPDFLLLDEFVCKVAEGHKLWNITRKEMIESWIEQGKSIDEFKLVRPRSNVNQKEFCKISDEDKAHIKVRLSKKIKPLFPLCFSKCNHDEQYWMNI